MPTCSPPDNIRARALRALGAASLAACSAGWVLAQSASPGSADELLAQAQQKRDAQAWAQALQDYRQGQTRFAADDRFRFGEIYVLADSGRAEQAVALAQGLMQKHPGNADVLLVMAYAKLRESGKFAALEYVDRAAKIAPDRAYVMREYVLSLQRVGMAEQALQIASRKPDLLNASQMRDLQLAEAAETVRIARLPSRSEGERFVLADRALARYAYLLQQWQPLGEEAKAHVRYARIDRLQAYFARSYSSELIREYEDLKNSGVELPMYALGDVASAYLTLRQPEQAEATYRELIASGYLRNDQRAKLSQDLGLMYALTDQDRIEEARAQVQAMRADYPLWRYVEGERSDVPNEAHLEVEQTAVMVELFANNTDAAQKQLKVMSDQAPWNTDLRLDLAWAYRIRGWPRLGEQELKITENYTPRTLRLEASQGQNAMALREWRQAEMLAADVVTRFPEATRARRLSREWEVHNMAEVQVSGYRGLSSSSENGVGNPLYGGRDFGLETTVYTQPLNYDWRLFAGMGFRKGRFLEGRAEQNFGRVGFDWRRRDWWVEGEVSSSETGQGHQTGARAAVVYDVDDYWQISSAANWRSRTTPLRALYNGITSNGLELGLRWRQSELREWGARVAVSQFESSPTARSNDRLELGLSGKERLLTYPSWFLDLGLDGYMSRNSETNVPYYSPRREYSLGSSLSWNHTIYQRYETRWSQQVGLGLGVVRQQGYGTDLTQSLSYGQRYRHNDVLELGATVSGLRRPYDGLYEREWRLLFDMNYRF